MTTNEAFVKVLQRCGIEHAFGIIGSAMMPVSDLFPAAGIKFWAVVSEVSLFDSIMDRARGRYQRIGSRSVWHLIARLFKSLDRNVEVFRKCLAFNHAAHAGRFGAPVQGM